MSTDKRNTDIQVTTDTYGRTLVQHPGVRGTVAIITCDCDRYSIGVDACGVFLSVFSGKQYGSLTTALKAATMYLDKQATRRAEEAAQPVVVPAATVGASWVDEANAITEEGYIAVTTVRDGVTTVRRGAKLPY